MAIHGIYTWLKNIHQLDWLWILACEYEASGNSTTVASAISPAIDLTSATFMSGDFYFIKPNDVIVVNPNNPRVKNAGFIGDINNVLTIASLLLSVAILVSR